MKHTYTIEKILDSLIGNCSLCLNQPCLGSYVCLTRRKVEKQLNNLIKQGQQKLDNTLEGVV